MLSMHWQLIRRLHKRLCQVLAVLGARVVASSAQRLHMILLYFQRIVANINILPRHNKNSKSSECAPGSYPVLTGAPHASGGCSQASTFPLPFHYGQVTPQVTEVNSTQDIAMSSLSPTVMAVPPISQSITPPQTSLNAEENGPVSSNDSRINLTPVRASNDLRHENRLLANKLLEYDGIPALAREFPNESCPWLNDAPDWQLFVHPEGALYLYNEGRRTFTEANIDETTFRLVEQCVDALYTLCEQSISLEDNDIELVLHVSHSGHLNADASCQYYFVDHTKRILFWLQNHVQATDDIFYGLRGIYDPSHIGYALESEYWIHCERYPNHEQDRVKLIKELRGLVVYARAEIITSDKSLSPFRADELSNILDLLGHLEALSVNAEDDDFPYSTCVIARFMHYFIKAKFFNFCGLPCARLDADKSVYKPIPSSLHPLTDPLSMIIDAMLFWLPQDHHNDLRRVWVDECIIEPRWNDFSRNLMTEWTGITIYSTVMLAVDVSFLAVPNVFIQQSQSVGVIATYISTIFITGSLITSLLLARQTQKYGPESAEGAERLLSKMTATFFGTKGLATVHSLPYAMLLWGMIFFAVAFLYNVFKSATTAMLASVISGTVVVTMFILWFIWAAREVYVFATVAKYVNGWITCTSTVPVEAG